MIEFPLPADKQPGESSGRQYATKRHQILLSPTNRVEIDSLPGGILVLVPSYPGDNHVNVARSNRRPGVESFT